MSIDRGPRTFLKVFVEVPDPTDEKSDDNFSPSPNTHNPSSSSSSRKNTSYISPKSPHSTQSQYCTITISPTSTAEAVCNAVARKRNLLFTDNQYELAMCDGDGQASYETILSPKDQPHQFQQRAATHGHLGDFHFVFRRANNDESDADDDSDGDSEPDIFGRGQQPQIKYGKYPAAWMEKRGKNHKAWRKRYFVLVDNELLYYKRRDVYEHHKEPIARIELVNPPGIIKILPPETIRKNNSVITLFLFDIHTPKRIYSLRIDSYNDMLFWVKALSRRNEPNELMDGLDELISESERLHSNDDEAIMEQYSTLQSILDDKDATDAYMRYLQSIHCEEYIHFWLDLSQYLKEFVKSNEEKQQRFARELYEKYIKSGAKYQLGEIKSKHRSNIKKQIQSECFMLNMFDDIKQSVYEYLNRDFYKFFNSSEYFRFIVTYKHEHDDNNDNEEDLDPYSWPQQFEKMIESRNKHKDTIMHDHSKFFKSIHSPVLNMTNMNISMRTRPQSPVHQHSMNHMNGSYANTWTKANHSALENGQKQNHRKHTYRRTNKKSYSKSIFDNAPGISSSAFSAK